MADKQRLSQVPAGKDEAEDRNSEDVHDDDIFEFLEGLVEGFRAAYLEKQAKDGGQPFPSAGKFEGRTSQAKSVSKGTVKRGGDEGLGPWSDLDALGVGENERRETSAKSIISEQGRLGSMPGGGYPGGDVQRESNFQRGDQGASAQRPPSLQRSREPSVASYAIEGARGSPSLASETASPSNARGETLSYTMDTTQRSAMESSQKSTAEPTSLGGSFDSVSSLMRLHALRSFFEETCGTVASAFDLMASTALRAKGNSGGGTAEERLAYLFSEEEFRNILTGMGYGIDATANWWKALFRNVDSDKDGAISLQDMYDTMVLDLPVMGGGADTYNVFFAGQKT